MVTKADKNKDAYIIHFDSKETFNPVPNVLLMNNVRKEGSNSQPDSKLACFQSKGMAINVERR